jgi:hypothetical protein
MNTPRIVGVYKGVGRLTAPNEEIAVQYRLTEYEDVLEGGVPGQHSITGVVIARARGQVAFPAVGQLYALHLQDGRKINVYIESGDGKVRATGGFF